jgi:hypothetical protein
MPYSVLKTSQNGDKKKVEVVGEFESEEEATLFAQDASKCDQDNEYSVEAPPPPREDPKPSALS